MSTAPLIAFAGACGLAWVTLRWLLGRQALLSAWQDLPNSRSLHSAPVPRLGGLAIHTGWIVTSALAWAAVGAMPVVPTSAVAAVAAFVLIFAVSLVDDRRDLPAGHRLAVHLAAAALFVGTTVSPALTGTWPGVSGLLGALLVMAILWAVNLYNFMDGSDGLAGGMTVTGFAAYSSTAWADAPDISLMAATVAGAAAGFLRFNFPPARVFMGDAGSAPLGFLAAAVGLVGVLRGAWPAWFPPLVFAPFIVDATFTLLIRALKRERVWEAHREHGYQKLVRMGWSHGRTALHAWALMVACTVAALVLHGATPAVQWGGAMVAVAANVALRGVIEFCWIRQHAAIGRPAGMHADESSIERKG